MNDVAALFFEGVVSLFTSKETLLAGSALAGLPGHVASEVYSKTCRQYIKMTNGRLDEERYFNCEHQERKIETLTISRKHLHHITIVVRADEEEYSTDREAMERVLSATKGKYVYLCLRTSNISDQIAKCFESIRLVCELKVDTEITSDVLKMLRSVVEKNTLNKMVLGDEISDETTQLLVDLLKQKQFHRMFLSAKCSAALKTIIDSWRENSEEMVGKVVYCKKKFSKLQLSSTEFAFQLCTEEDEPKAKRAYPFAGFGHASPQNWC